MKTTILSIILMLSGLSLYADGQLYFIRAQIVDGYTKLAWRKGIEVEVNSPLISKELLPIQPLDKYEIPYDFLRE